MVKSEEGRSKHIKDVYQPQNSGFNFCPWKPICPKSSGNDAQDNWLTCLPMCFILRWRSTFQSFETVHIPRNVNEDRSCPSLQTEHRCLSHLFSSANSTNLSISVELTTHRRCPHTLCDLSPVKQRPACKREQWFHTSRTTTDVTVLLMHFLTPLLQKVLKYFITMDLGECKSLSSCPLCMLVSSPKAIQTNESNIIWSSSSTFSNL